MKLCINSLNIIINDKKVEEASSIYLLQTVSYLPLQISTCC